MTPLLFAAALAFSGPTPAPLDAPPSFILKTLPDTSSGFVKPTLNSGLLVTCKRSTTQASGPNGAPVQKLGDLPPGIEEHTVLRIVNGCPVREVVYAGQTYYLDAPTGGMERDLRGSRIARH